MKYYHDYLINNYVHCIKFCNKAAFYQIKLVFALEELFSIKLINNLKIFLYNYLLLLS